MRQCPICKHWALEYDDYFGRYRCFNPDCEWMPASSAEREINLLETGRQPKIVCEEYVPPLNLTISVTYDPVNDVLGFDFGLGKQAVDVPEPDGRLVWKVDPQTDTVVGFELLEAKRIGVSEVRLDIETRKRDIEQNLKRLPRPFLCGRPTQLLITSIAVLAKAHKAKSPTPLLRNAIERFRTEYCDQPL
jgi:hypothetical protein